MDKFGTTSTLSTLIDDYHWRFSHRVCGLTVDYVDILSTPFVTYFILVIFLQYLWPNEWIFSSHVLTSNFVVLCYGCRIHRWLNGYHSGQQKWNFRTRLEFQHRRSPPNLVVSVLEILFVPSCSWTAFEILKQNGDSYWTDELQFALHSTVQW